MPMIRRPTTNERWAPIEGFEGLYEVSDHGRVRSLDRLQPQRGKRRARLMKGYTLKPRAAPRTGYYRVTLWRDIDRLDFYIHVLVCTHFIGTKPSSSHEVNHKDRNRTNNHYRNLEWVTRQEQMQHAYTNPLHGRRRDPKLIAKVRSALAEPYQSRYPHAKGYRLIAKQLDINIDTVRKIDRAFR